MFTVAVGAPKGIINQENVNEVFENDDFVSLNGIR